MVGLPRAHYPTTYDPIVLAYGRALLADDKTTTVITADLREPQAILAHPDLRAMIDLSRPVGVLFMAVLHFIRDDEDPYGIVGTFRDAMAPGSYLAVSQSTTTGMPPRVLTSTNQVYDAATSPSVSRSLEQITRFFDGLELVEPGVVRPGQWRPDEEHGMQSPMMFAGVAKKTG